MMNLYKNSHQLAQELITQLSPAWGVSGYEHTLKPILKDIFNEFPVEITDDFRGN
ncbi:MAG: M42 family peptidase, partial [Peptococcaceae bacterium]|nr:M42 family peptidase [Peptococcaceae bacterium]